MNPTALSPVCFISLAKRLRKPRPVSHALSDQAALALAEAIQVLCCGEESAVLAFRGLARHRRFNSAAAQCLKNIAQDEMWHDCLLQDLRLSLPTPCSDSILIKATTQFYRSLSKKDGLQHLTQIYALDSGACLIFSALRKASCPIGKDPVTNNIFATIHKDEVKHVITSRAIAKTLAEQLGANYHFAEDIAQTREHLARLMLYRAEALETLHIDPDRLKRNLLHIPTTLH